MLKLYVDNMGLDPEILIGNFSAGEVNMRVDSFGINNDVIIYAELTSSEEIMRLIMLKSIIDRMTGGEHKITLRMPYVPYSRQDRVCSEGEAMSLKVFAGLINDMHFYEVVTWNNHSDVTTALINRCTDVPMSSLMSCTKYDWSNKILVAPDAGAAKKTHNAAGALGLEMVQAMKHRDVKTGLITHTEVYGDVRGRQVVIVDDICDGGRTFIALAKVLLEKGAKNVDLYVTHGIFSYGKQMILDSGINNIICNNEMWSKD